MYKLKALWFKIRYTYAVLVFDFKHIVFKRETDETYMQNYIVFARKWKAKGVM